MEEKKKSKIIKILLIITAILAVAYIVISYKLYVAKIERKMRNNFEASQKIKNDPNYVDPDVLKSLTAPKNEKGDAPLDPTIINSLTAPAN